MTTEQIQQSIETGELKLGTWDKFTHYGIVAFVLAISSMFIIWDIEKYFDGTLKQDVYDLNIVGDLFFILFPATLGVIFYRLQRDRLKFEIVKTNLSRETLGGIIEKVGNELKWEPQVMDEKVIIAKTRPGFLSWSWGEQITILFDNNRVFVNSISDLSRHSPSIVTSRNEKNEYALVQAILKASR